MSQATMQATTSSRPAVRIANAPARHWVGDGFPVHGMFDYQMGAAARSPFLLMDYGAPMQFAPNPTGHRRGVGSHPHRGFETVTIVYAGEVEHRDSTGSGGVIGPGDVQWMTAGSGILHEEFHSTAYSQSGGPFQMVQLWVNLPAKDKMTTPGYQGILNADIPAVPLGDDASQGQVRVIAGAYAGHQGPAHTFTPMNVWDVRVAAGRRADLPLTPGWTHMLVVLGGRLRFGDGADGAAEAGPSQLVTLAPEQTSVDALAAEDSHFLLLSGEPIDEPIVGHGPFVMNTRQEIMQAMRDFNDGKFGRMQ